VIDRLDFSVSFTGASTTTPFGNKPSIRIPKDVINGLVQSIRVKESAVQTDKI
jgi:hypothetical protein